MEKYVCPKCNSKNTIPIEYGMPIYEVYLEAKQGKIKLGGCCEFKMGAFSMADRYCKDCENEWGSELLFRINNIRKVCFEYGYNLDKYCPKTNEEVKWKFEILSDGTIKCFSYVDDTDISVDINEVIVEKKRVRDLYESLVYDLSVFDEMNEEIIDVRLEDIIDDGLNDKFNYKLNVINKVKIKQKHHEGVNKFGVVRDIKNFLKSIPEMQEKINFLETEWKSN